MLREKEPMAEYQTALQGGDQETSPRALSGCLWRAGILILVLLTAGIILRQFSSTPLRISKETTHITEPLTADGKRVDYVAAIEQVTYPENIASDENGYRLIVKHLGAPPGCSPQDFEQICAKLGLSPTEIRADMTCQDAFDYLSAYAASKEYDEALVRKLLAPEAPQKDATTADGADAGAGNGDESENEAREEKNRTHQSHRAKQGHELASDPQDIALDLYDRLDTPWTLDEVPMMEQWLAENGPAIDLLNRAVRRPAFSVPIAWKDYDDFTREPLLAYLQRMRSFGRVLHYRAHYHIGVGDIDSAINDMANCKRLGRHLGNDAMVVELLVGIAIEGIADAIGVAGSLEHPPTKEQLQRLVDEMNNLPPRESLRKVLRIERYFLLDKVQSFAWGDESFEEFTDFHPLLTRCVQTMGLNWNVVARRLNDHFDALLATGREPPEPSFTPLVLASIQERSEMVADSLGDSLLISVDAVREAVRRTRCGEHMRRISLAMLIYERDHGALPPAYSVDEDGKPLHSWRVLLLPCLGQQELYEKIRLNEPWDGQYNRQFHDEVVPFYRCPSRPDARSGQTTYSVIVGPDVAFQPGTGRALSEFGPRSNDLILVVERGKPICWMDPMQEIQQSDAEAGISGLTVATGARCEEIASHHPGGVNSGLRSGAVRFLTETIDNGRFKALLHGTNRAPTP